LNCWHCERPAHGVCSFCGRGVCKDHAKERPGVLGLYAGDAGRPKALAVQGALWCGVCQPSDEPIDLGGE
jgi:hypothetical protein